MRINEGKKNPNYKDGIGIRLRTKLEKEPFCKICGSSHKLVIHHMDANHDNNKWSNLVVLCNQCHNVLHQRGYNFRRGHWTINFTESFSSIQGEGPQVGTPVHFFRLFGCNLNCKFCDSDYSKRGNFKILSYSDIISMCKKWKRKSNIDRVVITGGEPFTQNIIPLLMIFKLFDYKVDIETNGTLPLCNGNGPTLRERIYRKELVDTFNISPKLKGSQPYCGPGLGQKLINKNNISQFQKFNYILKFVCEGEKEFKQVREIQHRCNVPDKNIWLMPLSTYDEKKDKQIQKDVWEYCVEHKIKYAHRVHVNVWGKSIGK